MVEAKMCIHVGGRYVSREELDRVPVPAAEGRWRPVAHAQVLDMALTSLRDAGYEPESMKLALSRNDARFWGAITLKSPIVTGVAMAVAVASSLDKSTSLRWGYGHTVFICDNGAWVTQKSIAKKHTVNCIDAYRRAITRCVIDLAEYRQVEAERIRRMQHCIVTDHVAESLLLRAYQDEQILSPQTLPVALKEWREPSFEEFAESQTLWRLFNAATFALQKRALSNPAAHANATVRLGRLLEVQDDASSATPATTP